MCACVLGLVSIILVEPLLDISSCTCVRMVMGLDQSYNSGRVGRLKFPSLNLINHMCVHIGFSFNNCIL
jgi:hypothetical protein